MRLTASIVRDFSGLHDLASAWTTALTGLAAPSPTALPAWSYGLMSRHVSTGTFRILTLYDEARLVLCLPYLLEADGRRPLLRAACEITPLFCPAPSTPLFERVFEVLTALHGGHALAFDHVETERSEVAGLIAVARDRYSVMETRRTDTNVLVDLSRGWDTVRAGLSANTREALRRARSRVSALGFQQQLRTYTRPEDMGEAFAEVLSVDARSWKYIRGGSMALRANEHAQFVFAFQKFSTADQARVFVLRLNDRPVAFILAIVLGDRAYMAVWSYADAFSTCSPGWLVMEGALRELAEGGVRQVDFWGRADSFKMSWSHLAVARHSLTFHPDYPAYVARRSVARAAAPFRLFLRGPAERYRQRRDALSAAEHALRPLCALLQRRRQAKAACTVDLLPNDRNGSEDVFCRMATEQDKVHLPRQLFDELQNWRVFEEAAQLLAAARVETWADGSLYVTDHWQVRADPELTRSCAVALLRAYPEARRLREPKAEIALAPDGSLVAAILTQRGLRS